MAFRLKSPRAWVVAAAVGVASLLLWQGLTYNRDRFNPTLPYWVKFGRGSGRCGLDTVKVTEDGTAILHRRAHSGGGWETATLRMTAASLDRVAHAIKDNRLFGLQEAYHGGVADGTQWVLWLKQGQQEKAVYFDNHFPDEVLRFADDLDLALAESGLEMEAWRGIGDAVAREHQRDLWDTIRRRRR
jgi:hypothetical protein